MSEGLITEYLELCERIAAEALFAEAVEARLYARLDQLWYGEMSTADRVEAQAQLTARAQAWGAVGSAQERKLR